MQLKDRLKVTAERAAGFALYGVTPLPAGRGIAYGLEGLANMNATEMGLGMVCLSLATTTFMCGRMCTEMALITQEDTQPTADLE